MCEIFMVSQTSMAERILKTQGKTYFVYDIFLVGRDPTNQAIIVWFRSCDDWITLQKVPVADRLRNRLIDIH
jgi:hypothetical protein